MMPHPADKLSHSCHNGPPLLHTQLSLLLLLLLLLLLKEMVLLLLLLLLLFSACAPLA
jgi:hypothetical protein